MDKIRDLRELYVHELRDLYDSGSQLGSRLSEFAKEAKNEDLRRIFEERMHNARREQARLEEMFSDLGESPTGVHCEATEGILREGEEICRAKGDANARDAALITIGNRLEHYAIAVHGSAKAHAKALGRDKDVERHAQSVDMATRTDERLNDLAAELNERARD